MITNIPIWIVSIPKSKAKEGYFESIAEKGDKVIQQNFSGKKILLRCISSKDHKKTRDELLEIIKKKGTDRYDPKRKIIFHEFYEKYKPDLFLDECLISKDKPIIGKILKEFYQKTKGDRKNGLIADIITIYSPRKMQMIKNVYEGQEKSDCFTFKDQKNKQKAFLGIIVIKC